METIWIFLAVVAGMAAVCAGVVILIRFREHQEELRLAEEAQDFLAEQDARRRAEAKKQQQLDLKKQLKLQNELKFVKDVVETPKVRKVMSADELAKIFGPAASIHRYKELPPDNYAEVLNTPDVSTARTELARQEQERRDLAARRARLDYEREERRRDREDHFSSVASILDSFDSSSGGNSSGSDDTFTGGSGGESGGGGSSDDY